MTKRKKRRGRRLTTIEISLTPLIDTALTLLVIFMIATPMTHYGIKVNLPFGKNKKVTSQQKLLVTIKKNGSIFFNDEPVKKNMLITTIRKALGNQNTDPVSIKADESISYGEVIGIVGKLRQAGVKSVAMLTNRLSS